MVIEFTIPDLGEAVIEVRIGVWLKNVGDQVILDEPMVELQTKHQKVALLAPATGVLSAMHKKSGETARVGEVIGALYTSARAVQNLPEGEESVSGPIRCQDVDEEDTFVTEAHMISTVIMSQEDRTLSQADASEDASTGDGLLTGDGGEEGELEEEVSTIIDLLEAMERIPKVPKESLTQSYEVPRKDAGNRFFNLQASAKKTGKPLPPPPSPVLEKGATGGKASAFPPPPPRKALQKSVGLSSRHKIDVDQPTWEEVLPSKQQKAKKSKPLAHEGATTEEEETSGTVQLLRNESILTVFDEVDMSEIGLEGSDLRREYFGRYKARLTHLPFFIKAAAIALGKVPQVGAQVCGDKLFYSKCCNVGIVFESNKGPVVPVLRNVQSMSFIEVVQALSDLQQRVLKQELEDKELLGGKLTITDYGVMGVHLITPPLHLPKGVALALNTVRRKPVVKGEKVEIRPIMNVALAYDQTIIGNRDAIAFLLTIKSCVEQPMRLFAET